MKTITDGSLPISFDSGSFALTTASTVQRDSFPSSNNIPVQTLSQSPLKVFQSNKVSIPSSQQQPTCNQDGSKIKSPLSCHSSSEDVSSSTHVKRHNHVDQKLTRGNNNVQRYILLQICPVPDLKDLYGTDFIANSLVTIKFSQKDLNFIFEQFTSRITLQTREFSKQVFDECFDGASAMKIFMDIISQYYSQVVSPNATLEKLALHVGQYLLTIGKLEHILREHCFKNVNTLFYRLANEPVHTKNSRHASIPIEKSSLFSSPFVSSFATITFPKTPNWFLFIPQNDTFIVQHSSNSVELFQCHMGEKNSHENINNSFQYSPVFRNVHLSTLKHVLLNELLPQQDGVEMLSRNDDMYIYTFLQRTKFQEYPDYITIQLLSVHSMHQLTPQSTFAAFSISKYGYSDWGANKERLIDWSNKLERMCLTIIK
ncbi:hypothetical protein C9374_011205 [Naegleria lovaniensis]|uniref:DEP domain-containing protein n=1 Tax=Naegleria lovaniensis TaxID=51637 RepID=A0AA88GCS5_NAELO|nr:uncharacterized protein C9374_011205 [Naegleria lovaniensis]KAG2374126.1 hypothetical protein C9374_011205 [Naegleria lovaniensis]